MSFPGLDQAAGTITLPLWVAGFVVAVSVLCLSLAVLRVGLGVAVGSILGVGLVMVAAATAHTFSNRFERADERRTLDRRMLELSATAYAPGSVLACLDANFSEAVEDSCEKTVFASPEMVAAAGAFVNARLSLLADGLNFARRSDPGYENSLTELRRAIEADRFGFVAQVLSSREGCTPGKCEALALLRDATRVRSNLNDRTFDELLARNTSNWPQQQRSVTPVATAPTRPPSGWKFPSATSIPAVSIMTNEPAAPPVQSAGAPPTTMTPAVAPAPKRPATPPAPRTAQPRLQQTTPVGLPPPVQLSPPVTNDDGQPGTKQP